MSIKTSHWFINVSKGHLNTVMFLDIKKTFDTIIIIFCLKSYPTMALLMRNFPSSNCIYPIEDKAVM